MKKGWPANQGAFAAGYKYLSEDEEEVSDEDEGSDDLEQEDGDSDDA